MPGSNAIKVDWSPLDAGVASHVVVVVNVNDDTDWCLTTLGASADTHTCTPGKAAAGSTYLALVIALHTGGGYTLGGILPTPTRVTLAAASSGS